MPVPIRVLFLQDDEAEAELLTEELRRAGYAPSVERVATDAEFAESLQSPPDIIITDYALKQWSGREALQAIRKRGLNVPVVFVSGTRGEEPAVTAMLEGAVDYLLKWHLDRLGTAVARALEYRRLEELIHQHSEEAHDLAAMVRSSEDAIIGETLDGVITSWNPAAEKLYGWTAEEVIGQPISLIVPLDVREEVASITRRLLQGERVLHHETERIRKDGTRVSVSLSISPVRNSAGRIVGACKIARDITERRRWDEERRASESRFRALVENSWDGVTLIDAEGIIRYATPATTRILGYALEEYVGRAGEEFVHPEDLPVTKEIFDSVAAHPGATRTCSYRYRHRDGSWVWVETIVTNLLHDPHVNALVLNSRDVTEARQAALALSRSEERYRSLAESIPHLVWVCGPDGTPEYFNRRWSEYTGATNEQLLSGKQPRVIHPDDFPGMRQGWLSALQTGDLFEVEYRLRRADGEYRWHIGRAVPVRDQQGLVSRWFGTCTDIHAWRLAENERSRLAHHIQLLLESTGEGIYGVNDQGVCTFINTAGAAMLGYSPEELVGREMHAAIHQNRPGGALYRMEECPIHAALRQGRGVRLDDEWLLRKDGTAFPVSCTAYPVSDDAFRGAVVTFQDISGWKETQEALLLRERAISVVSQGILITDATKPENPIVYASPGFERMTGYRSEEVLGRNCRFLQGPDTDSEARARIRRDLNAKQSCRLEILNYRKDGTTFWNEIDISPIRDDQGQLTHYVGVQSDVTERKQLEERYHHAQKMEAVGQLAGGVAHDFNNLLTIINGYSDLLLQRMPPHDPSRELINEIHKAGERSAVLTRQLLAFSRRQVLAPRVIDLNAVVADTQNMLRRVIGEDVQLDFSAAPGLWPVKADPGQLDQVILNLAVNARDAMPTGGRLTIETRNVDLDEQYVTAHPTAHRGPHALLAISDTGTGMTKEVMARIFEPFFTTKGPGKGTGLGLATVYGILTQSGGHISVYSEVGIGTTFQLYLPRADAPAPGSSLRPAVSAPPKGSETVLLVEDDPGVRALTRHVLAGCGYRVLEAADGEEATRIAARHIGTIDLLVTDVVMPGQGGRQVAERLIARHQGLKVLFVSGYTDDDVVRHGLLTDSVDFLQKPFSPTALAHKVREILDRS